MPPSTVRRGFPLVAPSRDSDDLIGFPLDYTNTHICNENDFRSFQGTIGPVLGGITKIRRFLGSGIPVRTPPGLVVVSASPALSLAIYAGVGPQAEAADILIVSGASPFPDTDATEVEFKTDEESIDYQIFVDDEPPDPVKTVKRQYSYLAKMTIDKEFQHGGEMLAIIDLTLIPYSRLPEPSPYAPVQFEGGSYNFANGIGVVDHYTRLIPGIDLDPVSGIHREHKIPDEATALLSIISQSSSQGIFDRYAIRAHVRVWADDPDYDNPVLAALYDTVADLARARMLTIVPDTVVSEIDTSGNGDAASAPRIIAWIKEFYSLED